MKNVNTANIKKSDASGFSIQQYSTIVFDLDGTLVDSVPDLTLALNDALEKNHLDTVTQDNVRQWVGNGSLKLVERALDFFNQNIQTHLAQLHLCFLASYGERLSQRSKLYPDVKAILSELQQQGKTLVLLTNKPMQFVPALLAQMGIADFFSLVLGGDSLAQKKPDPLPLQHVIQCFDIFPQDCLMVGDSRSDIVCAQQAQVDSVALLQGYHQGIDLKALNPSYVFETISALYKACTNI